jgi:1,4-dihydroxy-2-naphthoyl-CoA hydrolase
MSDGSETRGEIDREKYDEVRSRNRWGQGMGLEILEISSEHVTARIVIDERHHQPYGIVHGGVYCSIVEDIASQAAGIAARERGARGVVGVNNCTDFIRSHATGELRAAAEPVHIGRSSMIWSVTITRSSDDALVARGQVRFHVLSELPDERRERLAVRNGEQS